MLNTPGSKSSEFLLSAIALVAGVTLLIAGAIKSQPTLVETGKWLIMTAVGGYSLARGLAKFGLGGFVSAEPSQFPSSDDKAAANVVANVK